MATPWRNVLSVPDLENFRDAAVALIVLDDGRYLMQLRDDKPGIFYPDFWGLFGGAIDKGEDPETALRRELVEELSLEGPSLSYFTQMDFRFEVLGAANCFRMFFEVPLRLADLPALRLAEGRRMEPMNLMDILTGQRVVPYDSFAIWLHYAWRRRQEETGQ